MESDEKYLERKFGRQNHFAVPDGYLQNLTASVMANVSKQTECNMPNKETANAKVVVMQPWWRRTRVRIARRLPVCWWLAARLFIRIWIQSIMPSRFLMLQHPIRIIM